MKEISITAGTQTDIPEGSSLIRLYIKKGEYIYARPGDIVMLESCDHLVKVHILFQEKVIRTIRCDTLKDFLNQLPSNEFMRVGRFCAVNLKRLSGGDFYQQCFEFDFRVSLKLQRPVSFSYFNNIGK